MDFLIRIAFGLLIVSSPALAGYPPLGYPTTSNVKLFNQNIDLNGIVTVQSGSTTPNSSATAGNAGSIYLNTSGALFVKQDAGSTTNWKQATISGGSERLERVKISAGVSPAITSQSGSWVSGISRTGQGQITVTFSGFSTAPSCTCSAFGSADRICAFFSGPTTTTLVTTVSNGAGTTIDEARDIICMGPK